MLSTAISVFRRCSLNILDLNKNGRFRSKSCRGGHCPSAENRFFSDFHQKKDGIFALRRPMADPALAIMQVMMLLELPVRFVLLTRKIIWKEVNHVMKNRILTCKHIQLFLEYLQQAEKSKATLEKYLRDVRRFMKDIGGAPVTKELVAEWKNDLVEKGYAVRSVNSMLASVNSLFQMLGWSDCRVKTIRIQRQSFCTEEQELTKADYQRLLKAALKDEQLHLILQTICSTGIRVSELRYFNVEAVDRREIVVSCKGKSRRIFLPEALRKQLLSYAKRRKIKTGLIFRNTVGGALDRSSIWRKMKDLSRIAKVAPSKVFPHNLRKLFARTFYAIDKDLAQLADVLGHSSINTTRIYIISTGVEHRRKIERMGLVVP